MHYATKSKTYPWNPADDCVFNAIYGHVYGKHPIIQNFDLRIMSHLKNFNIYLYEIADVENPKQIWLNI